MARQNTAILVAFAVACAAPAAHAASAAAAHKSCAAGVAIAGKRTCLSVGKACGRPYESKYKSKGFSCKRDAKGRYRLKRSKQSF